jgi:hypothetical protein
LAGFWYNYLPITMTLDICLGHKNHPEFSLQPGESFSSAHRLLLPVNIRQKTLNVDITEYSDITLVSSDLPVQYENIVIRTETFGSRTETILNKRATLEILSSPNNVLLTLRRH